MVLLYVQVHIYLFERQKKKRDRNKNSLLNHLQQPWSWNSIKACLVVAGSMHCSIGSQQELLLLFYYYFLGWQEHLPTWAMMWSKRVLSVKYIDLSLPPNMCCYYPFNILHICFYKPNLLSTLIPT